MFSGVSSGRFPAAEWFRPDALSRQDAGTSSGGVSSASKESKYLGIDRVETSLPACQTLCQPK